VVQFPEMEGTNLCSSYWPQSSVAKLAQGFENLEHFDPSVDPDESKRAELYHDAYLLRRSRESGMELSELLCAPVKSLLDDASPL
jgi:hypothetical protein